MLSNSFGQSVNMFDWHSIDYFINDFWRLEGDPRLQNYPLMNGGPWMLLWLTALYLYTVKIIGPKLMESRKPFVLHKTIRYYNIFMALWNCWGLYEALAIINIKAQLIQCQPVNSEDPTELRLIRLGYIFIISRLVEFADTIFFVLRKSYRQISVLHIIHHSSVPIMVWFGLKFAPGSQNSLFPLINTFVHIIMYTYYALSTYGPAVRRYLWWKKYLTQLQLTQFLVVIGYSLRVLFVQNCSFPKLFTYISLFVASVFLCLFTSFYIKNYNKSNVLSIKRKADSDEKPVQRTECSYG